ncbi:LPXTG cell wall anchor domain-containing protein [Streptomyces sp. SID13666]|uniref:LPXTG cell wall anchor domain-containing protein n=1 Tax=unclassified Streptomyces TaxID=2593676 RepID=UPI0013C0F5B6|nr:MULTISPECIES: LPXTG cell wall anchor domain-containing protein [unclassified Streptomyces]NEA55701.1 LPXTG cell wall anchor domain-containing protein [Streptomyces sp. SID13666]NEA73230.1 LPXTG cell wall anchor domain-containing protein [Streptomyces sp. SID13588]
MSARTLSRRPRLAAAAAVAVAAVCGTALMPAAAYADAPATKPLHIEFGTPSPAGPLARGGATESYTVSATNNNDKAVEFNANVFGIPSGASPLDGSEVKLAVVPVSAPATDIEVGRQDMAMVVHLHPHGTKSAPFSIPANTTYTWKITVGLNADFPANDGNLTLTFDTGNYEDNPSHSIPSISFQASPSIRIGTIKDHFGGATKVSAAKSAVFSLDVVNEAGGHFSKPLRTQLTAFGAGGDPALDLFVWLEGRWVEVAAPDHVNTWLLPDIPTGFAEGTYHYKLMFTLPAGKAPKTAKVLELNAQTGLSSGNTSIIAETDEKITVLPTPPVTTPTGTPSATPTPSPSSTTNSPAPSAPAATDAPVVNTKASLAHTGANGSNGTLVAGAGALVALGAAMAFIGLRRRRQQG